LSHKSIINKTNGKNCNGSPSDDDHANGLGLQRKNSEQKA